MTDAKNILFFMCAEDRGGAEISMIRLAQGLAGRGYDVTLAVYSRRAVCASALVKELGFAGTVIDFGSCRTMAVFLPLFHLLRKRHYDAMLSALTHTNLIAVASARLASLWTRRSLQVYVSEHGLEGINSCEKSAIFSALARFLYARADTVVAVSQALTQAWRDKLPARAHAITIYNPIFIDRAPMPPAHPWLIQRDMPTIIGIGRLKAEKNFALLIRAFAMLSRTKKARLVILGEGEERAMLESLAQELGIAENILMPGFTPAPQAWLAYADLFVCPSKSEGLGNAIIEAIAWGVAVVSTDCPFGPAEILAKGRWGRLVPMDDVSAMAQAMIDALAAVHDREALKMRAQDFSEQRCLDAYAALIDNKGSAAQKLCPL